MSLKSALGFVLLSGFALVQTPPAAGPSPETKKLDYFVGTWTGEGTIQPGPWGPGGKYSTTHVQKWLDGGFILVGHSETKLPPSLGGQNANDGFIGYDPDKKAYFAIGVDSHGGHGETKGTLDGDTWTWTDSGVYDGRTVYQKEINQMLAPDRYHALFYVSDDGVKWALMMDTIVIKSK